MAKRSSAEAGYSGTPLPRKLGLREGMRVAVLGAPPGYLGRVLAMPPHVRLLRRPGREMDFIQVFAKTRTQLSRALPRLEPAISRDGQLWVSWPKRSSGVDTDLDGNVVRQLGLATGLVDVKVCAVDDVWSGLKFVRRRADRE